MKQDYTHITVILDRTGSMQDIRDDIIGGFNTFLEQQQQQAGTATMTLVQFDSKDPYEVIYSFRSIKEISPLTSKTYIPRASTNLFDAIGHGIIDLETQLSRLKAEEYPSKILFVIVTDGKENASTKFSRQQVNKMIEQKKEEGWEFLFLSSDIEAIEDAKSVGVDQKSVMAFQKDQEGTQLAWARLSDYTSLYRRGLKEKLQFDTGTEDLENDKTN